MLDDDKYNRMPPQTPPSIKNKPPPGVKPKSSAASSSGSTAPSVPPPQPPPEEDPTEDQNVWYEILKLEGRKSNNKISEGFVFWLHKNLDSIVY